MFFLGGKLGGGRVLGELPRNFQVAILWSFLVDKVDNLLRSFLEFSALQSIALPLCSILRKGVQCNLSSLCLMTLNAILHDFGIAAFDCAIREAPEAFLPLWLGPQCPKLFHWTTGDS